MCVFCAAVPAALALGASARAKQKQAQGTAETQGESRPKAVIPAGPATAIVVTGLVISSIIYHTHGNL